MFRSLVASGAPIFTAELPAVDGGGLEAVEQAVAPLAPLVDAINITDNTAAHAHASNVAVAIAVQRMGVEPIMQAVCRDRNRLALQADIAGAALHGVTNLCCLTGDDVTAGDEPEARRVFDLDGPQLIRVASALSAGQYLSGRTLAPLGLFIGAVENPGAPPLAYRANRAGLKIRSGARFLQLQICYREDRLAAFMAAVHRAGLTARAAFLPTIMLVKSARGLRFMDTHVPGISIPESVIASVEAAPDPAEAAYQLALGQARHALSLPGVRGLHLAGGSKPTALAEGGAPRSLIERLLVDLGVRHAHRPQLAV